MIKFDTKEQFWSTGISKNMVSVQDVIDILSALTPPEGRTLSNIPFGFINTKGRPIILLDENKNEIIAPYGTQTKYTFDTLTINKSDRG